MSYIHVCNIEGRGGVILFDRGPCPYRLRDQKGSGKGNSTSTGPVSPGALWEDNAAVS